MSAEKLYRIGGGAVVLGGLVVIAATIGRLAFAWDDFNNPGYVATTLLQIGGSLLVLMGLPAIAVFVAVRSPWFGIATYVALWIPTVFLNVASNFLNVAIGPYLLAHGGVPKEPPGLFMPLLTASIGVFLLGAVVIAIGIVRTRIFPVWLVGLMFLGVVCEFVPVDAIRNGVSPSLDFATVATMGWLVMTRSRGTDQGGRARSARASVRRERSGSGPRAVADDQPSRPAPAPMRESIWRK